MRFRQPYPPTDLVDLYTLVFDYPSHRTYRNVQHLGCTLKAVKSLHDSYTEFTGVFAWCGYTMILTRIGNNIYILSYREVINLKSGNHGMFTCFSNLDFFSPKTLICTKYFRKFFRTVVPFKQFSIQALPSYFLL